ncbi:MAG: hypothetical protein JXA78_01290, partial [Anaerolineales bacterium]|nr:hypothetical protein [Anaerolineales bacterium]
LVSFNDTLVPGALLPTACLDLAPGASCSFSYTYVVQPGDDSGEVGATLVNTASVVYNVAGFPNMLDAESSWTVTLLHPDFTVAKTCETPLVAPEEDAVFKIVFENTGDVDLIVVADEDLYYAGGMYAAGAAFDLPKGALLEFTTTVTAGYEPTVDNTVNAAATLPEWTGLDNVLERTSSDFCQVYGRIIIHKLTTMPSDKLFDFLATYYNFSLKGGESNDTGWTLQAGPYEVKEVDSLEWKLESITCIDPSGGTTVDLGGMKALIGLRGGETVECTFLNRLLYLGYTPGFWKNHTDQAPSGHDAWQHTNYTTGVTVGEVFDAPWDLLGSPKGHQEHFNGFTLLQALSFKGGAGNTGAAEILLRAGVASLLNASINEALYGQHNFGYFPHSTQEIIDMVNAALSSGDRAVMLALASYLDGLNNGGSDYFNWGWIVPVKVTSLKLGWSLVEGGPWTPMDDDLLLPLSGFALDLDPAEDFYYLNVTELFTTKELAEGLHEFYLVTDNLPGGFEAYWNNKMAGWPTEMKDLALDIIQGNAPIFYLKVTAGAPPAFMLVDGFQYLLYAGLEKYLRVDGDYPLGSYMYRGKLRDAGDSAYRYIYVRITFK